MAQNLAVVSTRVQFKFETYDYDLDKNVFAPKEEKLVGLVEARIVVTNTNEYELA